LRTPSGIPAALAASPRITAVSGVIVAGFTTMVFPMMSAGAIFQMAI